MIYNVRATLLSPLTLTLRRNTGNDVETLSYIPGATLRGALAARCLESHPPGSAEFRTLFLNSKVRFGFMRLDGADAWPSSTRLCKEQGLDHPIVDRLLPAAAGIPLPEMCAAQDGENRCDAKIEPASGFVRWEIPRGGRDGVYLQKKLSSRRIAHAAVHPALLRTRTAQLFSVAGLEAGQTLKGRIVLSDDSAASALDELIPRTGARLRMGRAKTRGGGAVEVVADQASGVPKSNRDDVVRRFRATQQSAVRLGGRLQGKTVLTVTLQSPAIVWDRFLMSRDWIEPEHIGLSSGWSLVSWFSSSTSIGGWHAAAGMPRTEVIAVSTGSCFAYATDDTVDVEALADWALRIETDGIGGRREEGFGEVVVCHSLHERCA